MSKELLIVFVKNIKLGKVKSRLANVIGKEAAFNIYKELVKITENATKHIQIDKQIYFSDAIIESKWENDLKKIQQGVDLGERMKNAFKNGFEDGYEKIILIGSDLPKITENIILKGFSELSTNAVVFGPAEDGGYYLVGLSKMNSAIFDDKPWSQSELLEVTLQELKNNNQQFALLETLNDIDTYEDLVKSDFYKNNILIKEMTKKIN